MAQQALLGALIAMLFLPKWRHAVFLHKLVIFSQLLTVAARNRRLALVTNILSRDSEKL